MSPSVIFGAFRFGAVVSTVIGFLAVGIATAEESGDSGAAGGETAESGSASEETSENEDDEVSEDDESSGEESGENADEEAIAEEGAADAEVAETSGPAKEHRLSNMIVTSRRRARDPFDEPEFVTSVTQTDIRERGFRTVPDALREEAGVHVQHTRAGAGSPFIRGMTGNQVLILYDGIRFNNSIFRAGPNQYLNIIDPFTLDRIEVVRGPASVLYGTDAMGGVINLIPRKAPGEPGGGFGIEGAALGRYASASNETSGNFRLETYYSGFGSTIGYTRRNFANLVGGRNTGLQEHTDYSEEDFFGQLRYQMDEFSSLTLNLARVSQFNVDRKDQIDRGSEAQREFDPQRGDFGYLRYEANGMDGFFSGMQATISYNDQRMVERRRTASAPNTERVYDDEVRTLGGQLNFSFDLGGFSDVIIGGEYYRDRIFSDRIDHNRTAGTSSKKTGSFPDKSLYTILAAYIEDTVPIGEFADIIVGSRYQKARIATDIEQLVPGFGRLEDNFGSWTGSFRFTLKPADEVHFVGGVSQGFRAPNMDDLAVITSTSTGQDVPTPGLDPESSVNYEIGTKVRLQSDYLLWRRFELDLFFWHSDYGDLIVAVPGTFQGLTIYDDNGNGVIDAGETTPVRQRANSGDAYARGIEFSLKWGLSDNVTLGGSFGYIVTRDKELDNVFSKTPPTKGIVSLRYDSDDERFFVEAATYLTRSQRRLSANDLSDIRIPQGGTDGFAILNLRGGYKCCENINATFGVENVFNRDYRWHGSSFNGAGTNFVFSLEVGF
ncbi:MAG: TonB-dependent receptor [Planctomycetes bacterium]|nr:TonB-dependent receptor [Planctomycetota bacterium]